MELARVMQGVKICTTTTERGTFTHILWLASDWKIGAQRQSRHGWYRNTFRQYEKYTPCKSGRLSRRFWCGSALCADTWWEKSNFLASEVRCDKSSSTVQQLWSHGKQTQSVRQICNCTLCLWTYCFNRLRESNVVSFLCKNVCFRGTAALTHTSVWEGWQTSQEQLLEYHRNGLVSSPIDLFVQHWAHMCATHVRFFTMTTETIDLYLSTLTDALHCMLRILRLEPPPKGK